MKERPLVPRPGPPGERVPPVACFDQHMNDAWVTDPLTRPTRLHTRQEVLTQPCPVPAEPGVYGWYFDQPPGSTPLGNTHSVGGWSLRT
jgi:hypothetical protein